LPFRQRNSKESSIAAITILPLAQMIKSCPAGQLFFQAASEIQGTPGILEDHLQVGALHVAVFATLDPVPDSTAKRTRIPHSASISFLGGFS